MLKKTIKYTDFDGVDQVEDVYFNLSKAELLEMELVEQDMDNPDSKSALGKKLQAIIDSKDGRAIISTFKDIVRGAYGERSADGKRFVKSEEISINFEATAVYSELFVELVTDAKAAAAFIRDLVPADLAEAAAKSAAPLLESADIPVDTLVSDLARERSEAQMQGHKKKETTPSLPSVPIDPKFPSVPLVQPLTKPLEEMTRDELIEHFKTQ